MVRPRRSSAASDESTGTARDQVGVLDRRSSDILMELQELGSMYDYLAKIILLGPSGSGK
jgi:hypothetical protein